MKKINIQRRKLLWSLSALAFLAPAYAAGVNISKTLNQNINDIILPAGSEDTNRMANKCLNCNLCVENCPNKILKKADNKFSAVHIDYSQGEGYCKNNCHKCSEICPSGAIKKISLEEKQHIRIAMAQVMSNCVGCGVCVNACPVQAIKIQNKKAVIDGSKCVGCGLCKKVCPVKAIAVHPINKQQII